MKTFIYLLSCVLFICLGSLFFLKQPDGTAWLKVSDFDKSSSILSTVDDIKSTIVIKSKSLLESATPQEPIYKWQDEQGVWHYSDTQQSGAEIYKTPDNLTVIPAEKTVPVSVKNNKAMEAKKNGNEQSKSEKSNKVDTLIKDAKGIQQLMDDRTKKIDENL